MEDPEKVLVLHQIKTLCEQYNIYFDPKKELSFLEEDTKDQVNIISYRMAILKENNLLKADKFYSSQRILDWYLAKLRRDNSSILDAEGKEIAGFITCNEEDGNILIIRYIHL